VDAKPIVLVVDEDSAAGEAVAILARSKSLTAEVFSSAEELLARADRSRLGCLVLNVQLPGLSGPELQEKLCAEGVDWPTVFVADEADVHTAVRVMRGGAVTFLEKPWGDYELWTGISRAIRRAIKNREDRRRQLELEQRFVRLAAEERELNDQAAADKTSQPNQQSTRQP